MNSTALLNNRYSILRELGQGGFGKTYLAESTDKKRVVVKEYSPAALNDHPKSLEMFQQEAQRLKSLSYPNIPAFIDYFVFEDGHYLVQEYVKGQSLQELVDQEPLSIETVHSVLVEILGALQYLHSRRIIHRDIKPANIMRRDLDGKLFLVDFGTAKQITETSAGKTATSTIGTSGYSAPEQFRGRISFANDIYSLGMSCAVLLTGSTPFEVLDLIDRQDDELSWRVLLPQPINNDIATLIGKMARMSATRRYQSVSDVQDDLAKVRSLKPLSPAKPNVIQLSSQDDDQELRVTKGMIVPLGVSASAMLLKGFAVERSTKLGSPAFTGYVNTLFVILPWLCLPIMIRGVYLNAFRRGI